eukprot:89900_1
MLAWLILFFVVLLTLKFLPQLFSPATKYEVPPGGLKEVVGDTFVKQDGNKTSFDQSIQNNKLIAIYFSAHWCPPCRGFTPVLKRCYNQWKKQNKQIEVIFCSGDSDINTFQNYFKDEHGDWLAIEFGSQTIQNLQNLFSVRGIPKLVVIDELGHLVDADGRSTISSMQQNAINKWLS